MGETLKDQLIRHEGLRLKPYNDSLGISTIGVGHNLTQGISKATAMFILDEDIQNATNDLLHALPWTANLDWPRKSVLINLSFNMGIDRLLKFHNMLIAVQDGNWTVAKMEMLNSTWAKQVGSRATELSNIMLTGVM